MLQIVFASKVELLVRLMTQHISFMEYLFKYNDFSENEPQFKYSVVRKGFSGNICYELVNPNWIYVFFKKKEGELTSLYKTS